MNYCVYFSPTGGTKKVVRYMGAKFEDAEDIDLSLEIPVYEMATEDFCIAGVPSFGGRMPEIAASRLRQLRGNQTPALIVVTYGNRAFEDALRELKDVLEEQGFVCVGAAAVVTEHSIMRQFGTGRPDEEDYRAIDAFLARVKERLAGECHSVEVPGNVPYKELKVATMTPQVLDVDACKGCGLCAKKCPVGAIPAETPQTTDSGKCISCMRCVSICPSHARKCDEEKVGMLAERLKDACSGYRQAEFFE